MVRVLKPGGLLILGLRSLIYHTGDHLMIATQNPHILGIYHTFLYEEAKRLLTKQLREIDFLIGEERPAGGRQFFLALQKNEHV